MYIQHYIYIQRLIQVRGLGDNGLLNGGRCCRSVSRDSAPFCFTELFFPEFPASIPRTERTPTARFSGSVTMFLLRNPDGRLSVENCGHSP